jgi:hypothetical protein
MSESEQEKEMRREPDVEGHKLQKAQDEGPGDEEAGLRREEDDPDVEGHKFQKS